MPAPTSSALPGPLPRFSTPLSAAAPLVAIAAALSSACSSGDAGPSVAVTVRDSAGVTIVENAGEPSLEGGGWSVGAEPVLSIGTFQGDTLQQLYRVQGAARLSDGRIVVANAGSGEIRVYGPDGAFGGSHGGRGRGPGEFQFPALAGVLGGDTLVVTDYQLRRISLIHAADGHLRSSAVDEEAGGALFPHGILDNRTVVVGGGFYFSSDDDTQLSNGYVRPPTSYLALELDGSLARDFGELPGSEFFMNVSQSGGGTMMFARLIPFGKSPREAVSRDRFFYGSGDTWEVRAFDSRGDLVRIIRRDREPRPVTAEDLDAHLQERLDEAEDEDARASVRRSHAEMPTPELMPAFGSLVADTEGHLWVERFRGPGEGGSPRYDVFDGEGRLVASVEMPVDMEILEIGGNYLLGLYRDELEVEYVRMYPLTRPGI